MRKMQARQLRAMQAVKAILSRMEGTFAKRGEAKIYREGMCRSKMYRNKWKEPPRFACAH